MYQTEKLLREHSEKISDEDRKGTDDALASLKEALAGDDLELIKSSTEGLMTASQRFSQQIYEAAAQAGDTSGDTTDTAGDDDVVDAEIVEDEDES